MYGTKLFYVQIMNEFLLTYYMVSNLFFFTRSIDPKKHFKIFRVKILILGGSDVVWCKVFALTLFGTALVIRRYFEWNDHFFLKKFIHIHRTICIKYIKIPKNNWPLRYKKIVPKRLNYFCDTTIHIHPPNEEMFANSFVKSL